MAERSGAWYIRRNQKWEGDRGNWDSLMEEIAEFEVPGRRGFTLTFYPGQERLERVYDSTVFDCITRFVDAIHFAVANPFTNWFELRFRDEAMNDNHEAKSWLEDCQSRLMAGFEESNWSDQLNENLTDWGTFGTAAMGLEESPLPTDGDPNVFQGFTFRSYHLSNVTWGEDADGRVRTANITWHMTAEQAYDKFANSVDREDRDRVEAILGKSLMRKLEDSPDQPVEFLHCIHQRDRDDVQVPTAANPAVPTKKMPYASVWVHMEGERGKKVKVSGYEDLPIFIARYRERSEDKNGIGLGELSLPDVRTLNEAERLDLGAWEQDIDPPIVQQGEQIIGNINFIARGITTVRDLNKVRAWTDMVKRSYVPNQVRAEEKREQIRRMWKYHQLDLPPRESVGEMTATEVIKRMQRIYQLMGPPLSRLINELISPAIERGFGMMLRRGAFLPAPEAVLASESSYDIEYSGPLARAQRLEEVETIDSFLNALYSTAEMDPEILDLLDRDEAWRRKAQRMGVPTELMRDSDQVAKIRTARAKAQEEQREIEAQATAAKTVRDAGAAMESMNGGAGPPAPAAAG